MAPDLNSLPPSRSIATAAVANEASAALRGRTPSPSPRSASISLQAAATVNAGLQHEGSTRSSSRSIPRNRQSSNTGRRSNVLMNLQLNDPNVPSPGEMVGDNTLHQTSSPQSFTGSPVTVSGEPQHFRAPSLGEIHQELEQEQEAQVNRLLQMIQAQQLQLQQLQGSSSESPAPAGTDDSTPMSERSMSISASSPAQATALSNIIPRSPNTLSHPRTSLEHIRGEAQRRSRPASRTASPHLRPLSISGEGGEGWSLAGRDESAFYQAETQMLIRENQMLRLRIRELERQVNELHANSLITHEPPTSSNLSRSQSVSEEDPPRTQPVTGAEPKGE